LQDDVREAYQLIKDLEPAVPQEYILKGVVNAALGQENGSVCQQAYLPYLPEYKMNPLPNLPFSGKCLYRKFLSLCVHVWLEMSPPIFQAMNLEKICILYSDKYSIFVVACLNFSDFSW